MHIHVWWAVSHIPQAPHHGCSMVYKAKQTGKCSICRLLLSILPDPDRQSYCLTKLGMQTCWLTLLPLHAVVPFFLIALLSLHRWILIACPGFPLRPSGRRQVLGKGLVRKSTPGTRHPWSAGMAVLCWDSERTRKIDYKDCLTLLYSYLACPCYVHTEFFRIWQEKCKSLSVLHSNCYQGNQTICTCIPVNYQ